jgi:hypothetical protein
VQVRALSCPLSRQFVSQWYPSLPIVSRSFTGMRRGRHPAGVAISVAMPRRRAGHVGWEDRGWHLLVVGTASSDGSSSAAPPEFGHRQLRSVGRCTTSLRATEILTSTGSETTCDKSDPLRLGPVVPSCRRVLRRLRLQGRRCGLRRRPPMEPGERRRRATSGSLSGNDGQPLAGRLVRNRGLPARVR